MQRIGDALREARGSHVVAHSLGGLLTMRAIDLVGPGAMGRVVCLGSPLAGSHAASGIVARIPAGAQLVVDSERMWHSVWHPGPKPRYCLISSFESGPALERWIFERDPVCRVDAAPLPAAVAAEAEAAAQERRANRTARESGNRASSTASHP